MMMIRVLFLYCLFFVAECTYAMQNPASVNCANLGGKLVIESVGEGDIGICYFKDDKQCEEWALFRGQCPVGGVEVTKSPKDQRMCLIRGGKYQNKKCLLPQNLHLDYKQGK